MRRIIGLITAMAVLLTVAAIGFPAVVTATPPTHKLAALTFDDGPSEYTDTLLNGLAAKNAKVTFFVNGKNGSRGAAYHAKTLQKMATYGHQIANHTHDHLVPFTSLTPEAMSEQTASVNTYLYNAMGAEYQTLVRTPGGATDDTVLQTIEAPIIIWSVDTLDWKYRDTETVYDTIINKIHDGAIVLLHDVYRTSVEAALKAIDTLQEQGYEFVTVSELFRRRGITLENGKTYFRAPNNGITLDAYTQPKLYESFNNITGNARISAFAQNEGLTLYYTTDGTAPTLADNRYAGPIDIPYGNTVIVAGFDQFGTRTPLVHKTLDTSYEGVFDAVYYADRYADLKAAYGYTYEPLLKHFLQRGIHEGRQASPVFSVNYYMTQYPALQATLGNDPSAYVNHFLHSGMASGVRASSEFDPQSYRVRYEDLQTTIGDDMKGYYLHYLRIGRREHRVAVGSAAFQRRIAFVAMTITHPFLDVTAVERYINKRYPIT